MRGHQVIPLEQHPANPEWAAAQVASLPPRWRGRLLRKWQKTRNAFDASDVTAEGDATRSAAYWLADTLAGLKTVSIPLDAADNDILTRAEQCARDCQDLSSQCLYGVAPLSSAGHFNDKTGMLETLGAVGVRGHFSDKTALRFAMAGVCAANHIQAPAGKRMTDDGAIKRMVCAQWWRRKLRKLHARAVEGSAIGIGYVNKTSDIYVSNESMKRRKQQRARNQLMMEATRARNELGQEYALAELAATSVANPEIKRNELMTRLGGFERIAKDMQHEGLFFTVTCPSRMHKWKTVNGGRVVENKKYDRTLPGDANKHLQRVLARVRSALDRAAIGWYGFRIAEPNHDGTPHWHCLVFFPTAWPGEVARAAYPRIAAIIRRYGLGRGEVRRPKNKEFLSAARAAGLRGKAAAGAVAAAVHSWNVAERQRQNSERGAKQHRVDFERIDWSKGSAAAYLAKYVSKNIDGYKVEKDLYGNDAFTSSQRVEAWASTWSIRQFQQIGGPPVGPWRELRRVKELAAGSPEWLVAAHTACNKTALVEGGNPTVSYAHYCAAQGGMFMGRDYRIKVALEAVDGVGRYGDAMAGRPVGVVTSFEQPYRDGIVTGVRLVNWLVKSVRHTWEIIVAKGAQANAGAASAWTRVNNCTPCDLTSLKKRFAETINLRASLDAFYQLEFCGPWNVPLLEQQMREC